MNHPPAVSPANHATPLWLAFLGLPARLIFSICAVALLLANDGAYPKAHLALSLGSPWVYGLQSKSKTKVEVHAVADVLEVFQKFCIEVAVIVNFPADAKGNFPPICSSVLFVISHTIGYLC